MVINSDEYRGKYELNRDSAKNWLKNNVRGTYVNKDTNQKVEISKVSIDKVTSYGEREEAHLKSLSVIPQLVENSIFIEEKVNTKDNGRYDKYQYYVIGINIDGVDYTAKIVFGVKGDVKYYDHNLIEIEKGALIDNLNVITKHVADNQNSLYKDKDSVLFSLLQTNSSKVVDENGEPLVVYHGTDNEFSVFDIERLSEGSGDMGTRGSGFYFSPSGMSASMYGYIEMPLFLSLKTPLILDFGVSFVDNIEYFKNLRNLTLTESEKTVGELIDDYIDISAQIESGELLPDGSLELLYGKGKAAMDVFKEMKLRQLGYPGEVTSMINMSSISFVNNVLTPQDFSSALIDYGYDGVIDNRAEDNEGMREIVAFYPNQIKSAIDNNGEYSGANDDILFRDNSQVNGKFNEELETLTEENADSVILNLGKPGEILLSAGVENRALKLYGNKVIKKMKKHGFLLSEIRDLPLAVNAPIAVFDNIGRKGNRSILTELKTEQGNFLVTVDLGKDREIDFNIVSSVFGKGEEKVIDWINRGYATYINKKKAQSFLFDQSAPIAATAANAEFSSATKIVENFENPKIERKNIFRDNNSTPSFNIGEDMAATNALNAKQKQLDSEGVEVLSEQNDILFSYTPEEQSIIENAGDNAFKAPNGKPSKLTPRQWVQVRTKAFKEW
ncbi:MAG: hypothetical protein R3Y04_07570, partial [Rikenellaceae bacterium]